MSTQPLPGFRDFYPTELAFRNHIFEAWRRVAGRYGFEEYDGPPLEPLDLYTSKSGDEIVGQLYNFVDKGDRSVALRPEMTPTLARMVAARANGLKKPIRWFSIPQLFRYERQQRGRLREHFQFNCDLIGESSPLADAEIIALAIDVMRELGLDEQDVRVHLSDRNVLDAILRACGWDEPHFAFAYQLLDKHGRDESSRLRESAFDRGVTGRALAELDEARGAPSWGELCRRYPEVARVSRLGEVIQALEGMGLGKFLQLDIGIVRGLAYYTGTVFELFDYGKSLRAVCGGGRYDNLTEAVGGVSLPAVGFGMGDVVLGELLKDRRKGLAQGPSIDVFLAGIGEGDQPHLLGLAHQLRDAGLRVEYALFTGAVGKQLKLADARQARFAVVIGPDDRAKGEVQVKDLKAKSQIAVPLERLKDVLVDKLKQPTANG